MKCRTSYLPYLVGSALFALTSQAFATSSIECQGINSDAEVSILIGAGPILNALEASAALNDTVVTSYDNEDIEHANIIQFRADKHELRLEMIDDQAEKVLTTVHIIRMDDDENEPVQAGYLYMHGEAPVAITCDGP